MESINYSTARKTLAGLMEDVCRDCNPVIITKNGDCAVVMISLQDFNSIMETEHLLRSPANAARLFSAIQSDKKRNGKKITLEQLEAVADEKPAVHA